MYRRYLKVQPTEVEDFIKFLKKAGRVEEAAKFLAQVRPSLVVLSGWSCAAQARAPRIVAAFADWCSRVRACRW